MNFSGTTLGYSQPTSEVTQPNVAHEPLGQRATVDDYREIRINGTTTAKRSSINENATSEAYNRRASNQSPGKIEALRNLRILSDQVPEIVSDLTAAVNEGEFIEIANLGTHLKSFLDTMWKYRAGRDENWQTCLTFLQSALSVATFESMSNAEVKAIDDVLSVLRSTSLDREDVRQAKRILEAAGLDPFAAISQPNPSNDH